MSSWTKIALVACALCLPSAACTCDDDQISTPAGSATASAASPNTAVRDAAQQGVQMAGVKALVEQWRDAQNQGDFEAYAGLYGPTFIGVKRVGEKTSQFDREGWLKDRKTLFKRDVTVVVRQLRIFTGERSAFVTFSQEWSSPRFRDVGPKRVELVLHDGKLLISREEMLASDTQPEAGAKAPPPEQLALLQRMGRHFGAVLEAGSLSGDGPPRKIQLSNYRWDYLVAKDAGKAKRAAFKRFRARQMDLYDGSGIACTGTVRSFQVVAGYGSWDPDENLETVWTSLGDSRYLVAVIEPAEPDCNPIWARASDLPAPTVLKPRELTADEAEAAARALRKTVTAREVQGFYTNYLAEQSGALPVWAVAPTPAPAKSTDPVSWWDLEPSEWSAVAFTNPKTGAEYVAAELAAGTGCGEFGGYALGFFKVTAPAWLDLTGNGDPRLILPARPLYGLTPEAAVVLKPGGPLFLIDSRVLYGQVGKGFEPLKTIGRVRSTCSC